ncbi:Nitrogen fixation protein of unknown function [Synechococcus sp. MIT S9509]|uniref:Nif11-like leader peptide family natural product precursor n=1 Tax=unclassified Synechococcus TaxID=2626047 RepID=UPI0007BAF708|nr:MULTISPECIES: Nif11-like leader peptide family natural product precursor [unclassified Synechococcus]KZR88127.1 Nitrogen fixation protein of unknown function [Synechococcus sp. MIT S9504]KZR92088.1 Nitrogen fixation protein of unknown function [Synechococcus sp. MIT S9509]
MSEEQLKSFIMKVQGDENLQAKLKAAANPDAVVYMAKEAGFSISADDLKNAQSIISDQELESAAGGDLHSVCGFSACGTCGLEGTCLICEDT